MSNTLTQSLAGGVLHAFALMDEFMKKCPENIWNEPFGKWPVGQQILHPYGAVDFFLRGPADKEEKAPFSDALISLKEVPAEAPAKELVMEYAATVTARVNAYIAGLDDAALTQKNEGLSARLGRDMNHAATLALLASHTMYHLGSGDAALRQHGIPGVF